MPEYLGKKYQYYAKAELKRYREVGYDKRFKNLEEDVRDYVLNHLANILIYINNNVVR